MLEALLPGAQHLQNLHPLVMHFPVALLTSAVTLYALAWLAGRDAWAWPAFWLLALGCLSAVAAVGTGLYAEPGVMVARSVRAELLLPHKRLMLGTFALALRSTSWAVAARPFPRRSRMVFVLLVFTLLATVTKGADHGGRLVYDYNAGGDACGQPIDFTR